MASLQGMKSWIFRFGVILTIFGVGLLFVGIASLILKSRLHSIGHGFFTGFFVGTVGLLCLYYKKMKSQRMGSFMLVCLSLTGVVLVCPVGMLLFMGEIVADTTANYNDDPPMCKEGCDFSTGNEGFGIEFDDSNTAIGLNFDCDSQIWKETCTDNLKAVYNGMAGSIFLLCGWALLLFVVILSFVVLCLCCGVKDETVQPYMGGETTEYKQYPVAYPVDMGYDDFGYPERVALFPVVDEKIVASPSAEEYAPSRAEVQAATHQSYSSPPPATPDNIIPEMTSPPPNPPNEVIM